MKTKEEIIEILEIAVNWIDSETDPIKVKFEKEECIILLEALTSVKSEQINILSESLLFKFKEENTIVEVSIPFQFIFEKSEEYIRERLENTIHQCNCINESQTSCECQTYFDDYVIESVEVSINSQPSVKSEQVEANTKSNGKQEWKVSKDEFDNICLFKGSELIFGSNSMQRKPQYEYIANCINQFEKQAFDNGVKIMHDFTNKQVKSESAEEVEKVINNFYKGAEMIKLNVVGHKDAMNLIISSFQAMHDFANAEKKQHAIGFVKYIANLEPNGYTTERLYNEYKKTINNY